MNFFTSRSIESALDGLSSTIFSGRCRGCTASESALFILFDRSVIGTSGTDHRLLLSLSEFDRDALPDFVSVDDRPSTGSGETTLLVFSLALALSTVSKGNFADVALTTAERPPTAVGLLLSSFSDPGAWILGDESRLLNDCTTYE